MNELQAEMLVANAEYKEALQQAGESMLRLIHLLYHVHLSRPSVLGRVGGYGLFDERSTAEMYSESLLQEVQAALNAALSPTDQDVGQGEGKDGGGGELLRPAVESLKRGIGALDTNDQTLRSLGAEAVAEGV